MYKNFIVDVEIRLDKFLSLKIDASRNQIEQLIQKEFVKVDGKTTNKNGLKLKLNQEIEVFFPEPKTFDKKNSEFIKDREKLSKYKESGINCDNIKELDTIIFK